MIYINGRFLTHKMAGIPRFSYEMCKAMHRAGIPIRVVAPCSLTDREEYPFPVVYFGKRQSHKWEQIDLYRFMRKTKGALLISFSGLGPALYSNHIMTIHDVSFWRFPQYFSFFYNLMCRILTPIIAKRAKKIITVSQFSKKEIREYLKLPDKKVEVIGNAIPSAWLENACLAKGESSKDRYILMVSAKDPRKNFSRAVEAFLSLGLPDVALYIVGNTGTVFKENLISGVETHSVRFLGGVSDEALIDYYRNAHLFVYPSLYEGFGIPPLEAMANDCPVLVSNIEPLQEVCGDAAYYCDPYDSASIADGMRVLLTDNALRLHMIEAGRLRVKKYSWDLSVKKIQQILRDFQI